MMLMDLVGYRFMQMALQMFHPDFVHDATKLYGDYPYMKVGQSFDKYNDNVKFQVAIRGYLFDTDCNHADSYHQNEFIRHPLYTKQIKGHVNCERNSPNPQLSN